MTHFMGSHPQPQRASLLMAMVLGSLMLTDLDVQGRTSPIVVPANEASKIMAGKVISFYPHHNVFYKRKLYTSSTFGLVETDKGTVSKYYIWDRKGSGISEGPWVDTANDLLWIRFGADLINFDGVKWRKAKYPKVTHGYISRDDAFRGFRGVSDRKTFWLEGARRAWKWGGPEPGKWTEELFPRTPSNFWTIKRVIPCNDLTYYILRKQQETSVLMESVTKLVDWPEPSDLAFSFASGNLTQITNYSGFTFPPKFTASHFRDIKSFATTLTRRADPVSQFIYIKLSERTRKVLEPKPGERTNPLRLQMYLLEDLNQITKTEFFYESQRFAEIKLSPETQSLLNRNAQGEDLIRLNQMLLEDAYPLEITRNHFIAIETAAGKDKGYVRTKAGDILEVSRQRVAKIAAPGICDAITASSSGTLLASFGRLGVFELKDQWRELIKCPYPEKSIEFEVHLAAQDGEIALGVTTLGSIGEPDKSPGLWVSRDREWLEVSPLNSGALNPKQN